MLQNLIAVPGGKRESPNYIQISGHVPKNLGLQFKSLCAATELTLSEGLEDALQKWIDDRAKSTEDSEANQHDSSQTTIQND